MAVQSQLTMAAADQTAEMGPEVVGRMERTEYQLKNKVDQAVVDSPAVNSPAVAVHSPPASRS